MNPERLADLQEFNGLYFDPETGKTYREDGTETGYTFERARWTGPYGLHFAWPYLNPFSFATHDTGVKMTDFAKSVLPKSLSVRLDEEKKDLGPFTRTVERLVVVSNGVKTESFSAGMLANSVIRNGAQWAGMSFVTEVKQAGFSW